MGRETRTQAPNPRRSHEQRRRAEIARATEHASVWVRETRRRAPWLLWVNEPLNACERCGTEGLHLALHTDEREILVDDDLKVHVCGPTARRLLGAASG